MHRDNGPEGPFPNLFYVEIDVQVGHICVVHETAATVMYAKLVDFIHSTCVGWLNDVVFLIQLLRQQRFVSTRYGRDARKGGERGHISQSGEQRTTINQQGERQGANANCAIVNNQKQA